MSDEFRWDPAKAAANVRKHDIGFDEARTVFDDPMALTIPDPDHSETEDRLVTVGMSENNRLIVVCHTFRDTTIRLIRARRPTRAERTRY